ncbi:MAG TPA: hypothetical protein VE778_00850 [Candidatus Bathyarchaeia archaeon]|jgi:hypothetical protein|nr:hypothetical protein [Candidatus Bathyarchaeia archaeon]
MPSPQFTVKRPLAVTSVTVLQFLLGFLWLGITLYLLFMSRSPRIKQGHDSASVILGLEIAAAILAPGAVFGLTAAYALHKNKLWGWWLSLLTNAAFALMLAYSMLDEGWQGLDPEMYSAFLDARHSVVSSRGPAVLLAQTRNGSK